MNEVGRCFTAFCTQCSTHLLWGYFISFGSHVDLLVLIHAGNHEEDAGPPGSPRQQPAQPEDDRPLVLLDNLAIFLLSLLSKDDVTK